MYDGHYPGLLILSVKSLFLVHIHLETKMSPFRSFSVICSLLFLSLFHQTFAQQYAGDTIKNSLPSVPGAELSYFRIQDPAGLNKNLTLINYYSLQLDWTRLDPKQLQRAVVVIHGLNQDPGTYMSTVRTEQCEARTDFV